MYILESSVVASIQTLRDYLRNTIKPLLDELIRRISANWPDLLREINQVVVKIETVLLPQISTAISTGFGIISLCNYGIRTISDHIDPNWSHTSNVG